MAQETSRINGENGLPRILIVEDERVMRMKLSRFVEREIGAEVVVAEDGEQAWELFQQNHDIQFVISDWMMPECDGPELCARIRQATGRLYTYFILATARTDEDDLEEGMASGADDYVRKPINNKELSARIKAGIRVVQLQRKLEERDQEREKALNAASRMQQGMLPDIRQMSMVLERNGMDLAFKYNSCETLGGDVLGLLEPEDGVVALFLGDVSGHGISASLAAVGLFTFVQSSVMLSNDPVAVVNRTNQYCADNFPHETYATMAYLHFETRNRNMLAIGAGHPPLILSRKAGTVELLNSTVAPVGLFPDSPEPEDVLTMQLESGDRIVIYTDGIIETRNSEGLFFSENRLAEAIHECRKLELEAIPDYVLKRVNEWRGPGTEADDDITIAVVEMR
jgi:sigma-B regulation protein RsbU (phosphoserine phosphatase)